MKENKNTKKALFGSILSMIVCVGLLVGSTFAWFTDSVTSKGNIIKSGNLDVTMEWADGREALENATWTDASTGPIFNNEKWEPGYAEAKHIKIENKGNLAFKYEVRIAVDGAVSELAEVIDVYYVQDGKQLTDRNDLGTKVGTLREVLDNPVVAKGHISKGEADIATIALKMQENAGNEYMGKSIGENFTIQLVATQYTEEKDSFGKDYDKDAFYADVTVENETELKEAIENAEAGDVIRLSEDFKWEETITIPSDKDIVLDGSGATLQGNGNGQRLNGLILVQGKATIKNMNFDGTVDDVQAIVANGDVTVEGCSTSSNKIAHLVYINTPATNVVIKNCTSSRPIVTTAEKNVDCTVLVENNKFNTFIGVYGISLSNNVTNVTIRNNVMLSTYFGSSLVDIKHQNQTYENVVFEGNTSERNNKPMIDGTDSKDTALIEAIAAGKVTGLKLENGKYYQQ